MSTTAGWHLLMLGWRAQARGAGVVTVSHSGCIAKGHQYPHSVPEPGMRISRVYRQGLRLSEVCEDGTCGS